MARLLPELYNEVVTEYSQCTNSTTSEWDLLS
ncbi:Uncharacterised protein [Mycobacteroides abscessus subsp. abscessus]|nr:Uncharacterised protein [Mycobacteroides abscessus subsp. abscessus]